MKERLGFLRGKCPHAVLVYPGDIASTDTSFVLHAFTCMTFLGGGGGGGGGRGGTIT